MKIGIIGGGASGIMSALVAVKEGADVTILEHMPRIGKKILLTGSGKCNLTNEDMDISHFHSDDNSIVESVLKECGKNMTLSFLSELGLMYKCKNSYYYPFSEQASSVLDVFRYALRDFGVNVICDVEIEKINTNHNKKDAFEIICKNNRYYFDKIIICCGSKAYKNTGSDGSGYKLAQSLGHNIIKARSALTYLTCKEDFYPSIAGIRTNVNISLLNKDTNTVLMTRNGQLQLTKTGISGIPVFDLSFLAAKYLDKGTKITAVIDFLNELTKKELESELIRRASLFPDRLFEELFAGLLHKNLGLLILKRARIKAGDSIKSLTDKNGKDIVHRIVEYTKNFETNISGTGDFDSSQVCSGGVPLSELTYTLESRKIKGLYFAGEIINVNGDCGGYNLQWAFSSAMVAAKDSIRK